MIGWIKKNLYFLIAYYFRFFAQIQFSLWKPTIILVTGSNGKTTLLHLLQSQLGTDAHDSHHANSTYGIPFDILGLQRTTLFKNEWIYLLLAAPFKAFKSPYKEKLYLVEADSDRPGEGKFLATLLNPDITLWPNVAKTHSMNFDKLVQIGKFPTIDEAIAYEYGYYIEYCSKFTVVNGDSELIMKQLSRTKADTEKITKKDLLQDYKISTKGTEFKIGGKNYSFKFLLPEDVFYSIASCIFVMKYLGKELDASFSKFKLPPGRSSIFEGIRNTTIVDSSYNANLNSMTAILNMYGEINSDNKWAVLGDMLEQGKQEQEEHEKLADVILSKKLKRIILMGPRISKHTYPKLKSKIKDGVIIEKFDGPKEVLDYLLKNLGGGETILFKGARFMEGVIENLLKDKADAANLSRREKIWEIRRRQWGL